jgi:hypothetical protein
MKKKGVIFLGCLLVLAGPILSLKAQDGVLWVERFVQGVMKKNIPEGWYLEEKAGTPEVKIEKTGRNFVLRLLSDNSSFGLKKEIDFDIKEYPYLNWQWKVSRLPEKGDFSRKETDDQAAQVYILFPRFPATLNTELVGYLWESNGKNKDREGVSPAWTKSKVIVLQAGSEKLNQWITEKRNVYEDYKRLFGKEPPRVGGLVLYINSQHTRTKAETAFGPIYFSKN